MIESLLQAYRDDPVAFAKDLIGVELLPWQKEVMEDLLRESVVEKALVKRIELLGGETRKVAWIGRRNAPDRFIMLPGPQKNFWAECKRPGKDAEAAQWREHERLRACGEIVLVIDSLEAIDRWFPLPRPEDAPGHITYIKQPAR